MPLRRFCSCLPMPRILVELGDLIWMWLLLYWLCIWMVLVVEAALEISRRPWCAVACWFDSNGCGDEERMNILAFAVVIWCCSANWFRRRLDSLSLVPFWSDFLAWSESVPVVRLKIFLSKIIRSINAKIEKL